jgi:hypothetical protein
MKKDSVLDTDIKPIHFDKNYTAYIDPVDSSDEIKMSSFDEIWNGLCLSKIGDFYAVKNGIIPGTLGSLSIKKKTEIGLKKFLNSARLLRPYTMAWANSPMYVDYPGQLQWPREHIEQFFKTPHSKIIINSARSPVSPWRMYAAIDREGIYPSRNFHCIMPKTKDAPPLEVLAAILNSHVANAFIDSFNRKRWLLEGKIESVPFPITTIDQQQQIIRCVRSLEHSYNTGEVSKLDDIIFDVYGICGAQKEILVRHFSNFNRPGFDVKETSPIKKSIWQKQGDTHKVAGRIISIDSKLQQITMMLLSSEDEVSMPIPENLPGWALEAGRSFEATIPACDKGLKPNEMHFLSFQLLPTSYVKMSTNDLEKLFWGDRKSHDQN